MKHIDPPAKPKCLIEEGVNCVLMERAIEMKRSLISDNDIAAFCLACVHRRNAKEDQGTQKKFRDMFDNLSSSLTGVKTIQPPDEPPKDEDEEQKEDGSRDDDRAG